MNNRIYLHDCKSVAALAVLGNDTVNMEAVAPSVRGAASVNFDKANGAANTIFAGVYGVPLIGKFNPDMDGSFGPTAKICWSIDIPDLTNVAYSFVRLGASAAAYVEWRYGDSSHTAGRFTIANSLIAEGYPTGAGNLTDTSYLAFGVAFDNEANTLANILVDGIWIEESWAW